MSGVGKGGICTASVTDGFYMKIVLVHEGSKGGGDPGVKGVGKSGVCS